MRLFIAIGLPEKIRAAISGLQKRLKSENIITAKFVEQDNLHFTLKFFGEVSETKLGKIKTTLQSTANIAKFGVSLAGLGAFPSNSNARVLFISTALGGEQLKALQKSIDEKLAAVGFAPEKHYENHITIARVKSVINTGELNKLLKNKKLEFGTFTISGFSLMKSQLTPNGPVYETVKEFKLLE